MLEETTITPQDANVLTFYIDAEPIIEINKEGFYFKGKLVKDKHKVYERFNEWLSLAEQRLEQ